MKIIPGYWDPRQLRFIEFEEPGERVDLLELQVVVSSDSAGTGKGAGASAPAEKKKAS